MKKNEKRMILILLVVLAIAIIIFMVNKNKKENNNENAIEENEVVEEFVQVLEDGTKLNTSTQLGKTKQVGAYKFENMQLTEQNNQTVLLADVTNISGSATELTLVDVILLDKNGEEIITVGGIIGPLEAGEKTQFNSSMSLDYANTYDFKIVIKN